MKTPTWPYLYNVQYMHKYIMIKSLSGRCFFLHLYHTFFFLQPSELRIFLPKIKFKMFFEEVFKIIQQFHFQYSTEMSYLEMLEIPRCGVFASLIMHYFSDSFSGPLKFAPKKKSEPRDEAFISLKKKYLHPRIFPVKVCLLRWMPVLVW